MPILKVFSNSVTARDVLMLHEVARMGSKYHPTLKLYEAAASRDDVTPQYIRNIADTILRLGMSIGSEHLNCEKTAVQMRHANAAG